MSSMGEPRVKVVFSKPSRAKQSFKDECDINRIINRYKKTGSWVDGVSFFARQPLTGDFSSVPDFQEALNTVINANNEFAALPAKVRDRFGNDPVRLLQFMSDKNNEDEAVKLGLIVKKSTGSEKPVDSGTGEAGTDGSSSTSSSSAAGDSGTTTDGGTGK